MLQHLHGVKYSNIKGKNSNQDIYVWLIKKVGKKNSLGGGKDQAPYKECRKITHEKLEKRQDSGEG